MEIQIGHPIGLDKVDQAVLALRRYQAQLAEDHKRGHHPPGEMIRACPLCQLGR